MWRFSIARRQEFIDRAKAAEEACNKDSNDIKSRRKWAKALSGLAHCEGGASNREDIDLLNAAISKLDEILALDPKDHKAFFFKGNIYCNITYLLEEEGNDAKIDIYAKAIQCFKKAKDVAPDVYGHSTIVEQLQRDVQVYRGQKPDPLPAESPLLGCTEYPPDIGWNDIEFFERKCDLNPDNAENFRKWGIALMVFSRDMEHKNEERKMIAEAIPKLEKALSLDPNDNEARQKLSNAHEQLIQLCKEAGLYPDAELPAVKGEYTEDDEMDNREDIDPFFIICSAMAEFNPNHADNWTRWGTDLMKLSCRESGNRKRAMIAEAIAKLENAFLINPNGNKAKQGLMKAYDQLLRNILCEGRCSGRGGDIHS